MIKSFYIVLLIFICNIVVSCSSEDFGIADSEDAAVEEELYKYWNLYDASLDSNLDSALYYIDTLKELAEREDKKKWIGNAYWATGYVQEVKGFRGEAIFNFMNAAKSYKEIGELSKLASIYNSIGDIYWSAGDHKTAISYLLQSKDIYDYVGSTEDKSKILRNIAICYREIGDNVKAEEFLLEGLKVVLMTKNYEMVSLTYNSLGVINVKKQEFSKAKEYFNLVIQFSDSLENGEWHKSLAYNNIGEAYFLEGKDSEAHEWLEKAIILGEKEKRDPTLVQNSRNLLAQLFIKERKYEEAIALLEEGMESFNPEVVNKSLSESLALISTALYNINERVDPLQYPEMNKKLIAYNQKLVDYNSRAAGFETKLGKITQQQAIQAAAERYAYNEQLLVAEKRTAVMKYLVIVGVFLLIGVLISAYVVFRRNRHYKKLYHNIEQILNKSKAIRHIPRN